ncbi:SRPBCC domain-containing protein [Candidatus Berkelbacteria bacterium]|nr:SRPBCC domain-containing protein [Candidatus Berkelbacteria bacterium]
MATGTIHQEIELPATPEEVYEAFTNPIVHTAMTEAPATGNAIVGGNFTAWDGYIEGTYRVLEPGKRLVMDWSTSEWPDGAEPSELEFTLSPKGIGTLLVMDHRKVPSEQLSMYTSGWEASYWQPMRAYFTHLRTTTP